MCVRFCGWMGVVVLALVCGGLMLAGCGGGDAGPAVETVEKPDEAAPPPPPPPPPVGTETAAPRAKGPQIEATVTSGDPEEVELTIRALTELAGMERAYAAGLLVQIRDKATAKPAGDAPAIAMATAL